MERHDEIIEFWIGDAASHPASLMQRNKRWFGNDDRLDIEIGAKFDNDVQMAGRGDYGRWTASARGSLALVILLDQFPRNIYRGTERAFAYDPLSLAHTRALLDSGADRELNAVERVFAYMPLQHAEDAMAQSLSLRVFRRLADESDPAFRDWLDDCHRYAVLHQEIISRFGRFPHRNRILGRTSTRAEQEYLDDGAETFGQSG
jgi:uncharacterized protein (DUF924 family)